MTENANALYGVLARKLDAFTGLSQAEKRAIAELPFAPHRFEADQDVAPIRRRSSCELHDPGGLGLPLQDC
jgi:hypothetical protein